MLQIIPAVLGKTEEQYRDYMNRLSKCEALKDGWVHIDFADAEFVPNETVGVDVVAKVPTNFKKEAHLMVSHPKDWVDKLVDAGFERIIFHIESKDDASKVVDYIKSKGIEVGVAIKMDTSLEVLESLVDRIDVVLVMAIVPGFQGQPFIPESLDRIREIRSKNWPIKVAVDGSVQDINAKALVDAGVNNLISGSYILKGDIDENVERLWEVINV
ncbi:MAG: ribulose-phosphate 3-epimerase [Patescibacteria group bacterium]